MKHPLAGKALYFYIAVWVAIIVAHTAILSGYYGFSFISSWTDAFLFNLLVSGLGLSYWYVVQYLSPRHQGIVGVIVSHILGIVITASVVGYLVQTILKFIFQEDDSYIHFLDQAFLWRLLMAVFLLALIVMMYYLLRYNNNLRQKEKEELELQGMLRHSELEMLKFQINPHFIFNSLNSISSLTISEPDKARDMVIKLSEFLRSSLGKSNPGTHTLKEEISQMTLYLDIEKVRFGDRLWATHEIDDQCLGMTLPNMILQPLYENAIKYGIYEQLDQVNIITKCLCEDGNLKISISNNYDSHGIPQKGKGIGLKNVRSRLELIYGMTGLMTLEKSRALFTVHLIIPQKHINDQNPHH